MKYSSQDLKIRVEDTIKYCEENNLEDIVEYLFDDVEETIITNETEVNLYLPGDGDDEFIVCIEEFLNMIDEIKVAKIIEGYKYISPKKLLIRVDSFDVRKIESILGVNPIIFNINFENKGQNFYCDLVDIPTTFSLLLVKLNDYSKYCPPYIHGELLIEIKSDKEIKNEMVETLIQAYIFEISSSLDVELQISIRPEFDFEEYVLKDEEKYEKIRLRPLLINEGMQEILKIFNATNEVIDPEILILYYTKVIEYVSQSVVKKEMLRTISNKLLTSETLSPNAKYILELEKLFDSQHNYKKDSEAIKLTVKTCCNIDELIEVAPSFLKKIKKITTESSKDQKNQAFDDLAKTISDTRNMIAHAKTNYTKKGAECPSNELEAFSKCLKKIAIQTMRWFARQGENEKIF